jgi:hypothetical protein
LHHESRILEEHEGLMMNEVCTIANVPLRRTMQWSQRPHLAHGEFYRIMIENYFGRESRTHIEDVMYGICTATQGEACRLFIYHPEGNIQRSTHLDGRAGTIMWPNYFAYDGDVPFGAPYPTALRVD